MATPLNAPAKQLFDNFIWQRPLVHEKRSFFFDSLESIREVNRKTDRSLFMELFKKIIIQKIRLLGLTIRITS